MTVKLNGSSSGSVSIDAPASTTIPSGGADVTLTLPQSGFNIPEYDAWVITSNFTTDSSSPDYFTSNWQRLDIDNSLFSKIGTGMTESSGVFSFPSTGYWQINGQWNIDSNSVTDTNVLGTIYATHNNSTYTMAGRCSCSTTGGEKFTIATEFLLDVTDTSNVKVKFASDSSNGVIFLGEHTTGAMKTGVIFKKIGET